MGISESAVFIVPVTVIELPNGISEARTEQVIEPTVNDSNELEAPKRTDCPSQLEETLQVPTISGVTVSLYAPCVVVTVLVNVDPSGLV